MNCVRSGHRETTGRIAGAGISSWRQLHPESRVGVNSNNRLNSQHLLAVLWVGLQVKSFPVVLYALLRTRDLTSNGDSFVW